MLLYVFVFLVVACTKNDNTTVDLIPGPALEEGLLENQKIDILGTERDYHLYIPENPINAPVVMLFHGNGSNNNEILGITNVKAPYKVWLDIAEQEDLILIVPNGSEGTDGKNGWNDCRADAEGNPNSNDVLFANHLIDMAIEQYQANASKVFAVGTSNGGHMAIRLAQEIPDKLKAFASIVAANPVNTQCTNSTIPISALIINGTEDPFLPYEGGPMASSRGEVYSTEETIAYWVDRNNTNIAPVINNLANTDETDNCTVTTYLYENGTNNTEVALYTVVGGGHTEPSIRERYSNLFKIIVKEQNGDIEMAYEVWNFFKTK